MKTRKMLLPVLFFISISGYSQQKLAGTTFGIRAGINFQNLNGKDISGDKLENKVIVGFNAGVNAEIPIAEAFFLQPGLLFSTKGAELKLPAGVDGKINLSYIEIPVYLLYKPVLGEGNLLLGFGPYLGIATGGKYKLNGTTSDIKWDGDVTAAQLLQDPYFKRLDAGANMIVGFEISKSISAQINAQLGLMNIQPKVEGDKSGTTKNTGFGLSVGYRF